MQEGTCDICKRSNLPCLVRRDRFACTACIGLINQALLMFSFTELVYLTEEPFREGMDKMSGMGAVIGVDYAAPGGDRTVVKVDYADMEAKALSSTIAEINTASEFVARTGRKRRGW